MRVIERVAEHYDTQEVDFGRVYRWYPECVVVECKCGKRKTLTRSDLIKAKPACECGTDNTASVREEVVLELLDEDCEVHPSPSLALLAPHQGYRLTFLILTLGKL